MKYWLSAAGNRIHDSGLPVRYANHYATTTIRYSCVHLKELSHDITGRLYGRQIALDASLSNVESKVN